MFTWAAVKSNCTVALHPEGVDRNHIHADLAQFVKQSPSTRRAWIEMVFTLS